MCGIVGIFKTHETIKKSVLETATEALAHRGPDGQGIWLSPNNNVGLGHRRLTIVDSENGRQPLFNEDGSIGVVVNGELYDEDVLKRKLQNKGYRFKTRSDSELILYLYQEYGLDFIQHLRGEFAFILYDGVNHRLIAGRDRFGIKPLCYHHVPGQTLILASEAKAIFAAGIKAEWNMDALAHVACFQYTAQDQTMFSNIHQLPPGHLLIYEKNRVSITQYWDCDYPLEGEELSGDVPAIILGLRHQLKEAIACRLRSDEARICSHLSGGIDSASIAAIASEIYGKPLPCFSVEFSHALYDESVIARRQAQHIGAEYYPISVEAEDMVSALSDAVYYTEGLAINGHLAAKFILNREIKKAGFKIALSGEGSDELFAGYPHLKQDFLGNTDHSVIEANPISAGIQISDAETLSLASIENQLGFIPSFIKAKAAIGLQMTRLLADETYSDRIYENIITPAQRLQLTGRHKVNQSSYIWMKYALAGYILRTLGDGCEMAHGIEGRVPFLDHQLFAFAKQIPLNLKIRHGVEKYILRETVKEYVTPEIYARQKHPFMAPPLSLLGDSKGLEFINDSLRSTRFKQMAFFDSKKVAHYLDALPEKSAPQQIAAEPAIMLVLTSHLLAQRYQL